MSSWVSIILIAVAVAGAVYVLLELYEVFRGSRNAPKNPVSGAESLVGSKAKVLSPFEQSHSGQNFTGRVRINGEDWVADLSEEAEAVPEPGAVVTIVDVDPSKLRLSVR